MKVFQRIKKYIKTYCKPLKFPLIPKEILLFPKAEKLKDFKLIELQLIIFRITFTIWVILAF